MSDAQSDEALFKFQETLASASKYLDGMSERTAQIRENLGLSEYEVDHKNLIYSKNESHVASE